MIRGESPRDLKFSDPSQRSGDLSTDADHCRRTTLQKIEDTLRYSSERLVHHGRTRTRLCACGVSVGSGSVVLCAAGTRSQAKPVSLPRLGA